MARFEIEQYELHVATYEVEARSAAEAIQRLFEGDGDMCNGSEYVGTCEQVGMNLADDQELLRQLRELGVKLRNSMVPSIRSVRRADDSEQDSPQ